MKRTLSLAIPLVVAGCLRPAPAVKTEPAPASAPITAVASVASAAADSSSSTNQAAAIQQAKPADSSAKSALGGPITQNDVARRAAEVFGDTCADGAPVAGDSASSDAADAPTWDIDVHSYESRDRVEHYVHVFSTTAREHIEQRLSRGTRYEPMIRAKLRAGGLPEDMYYLALVESGFDPNAYSRAAAVGMWQFMTSTARDMGLRVDWWIDERRDPFRSTDAAVGFIKGLRDQFGSLYLAAAAYNGGPGRISRGLSRYADDLEGTSGDDLFFALADKDYLRNETRDYVPQLIAAALIGKEPERYGITLSPEPAVTYDSSRVGPETALGAVAKAADTTVDAIRELNPEILRGVTPPKDSFYVRIPAGRLARFDSAFAELPKSERVGLLRVTSKKGQRLETIAEAQGISTRQLAAYNPTLKKYKSGRLFAGQTVLVPTAEALAAATSVPDPSIERYGSSRGTTTTHVVKSGETISGIAKKYHTTTAAIMRANGLKRALIFPGQSLVVRGGAPSKSAHTKSTAKHTTSTKRHVASAATHSASTKRHGSSTATQTVSTKKHGSSTATHTVSTKSRTSSASTKKTAKKRSAKP